MNLASLIGDITLVWAVLAAAPFVYVIATIIDDWRDRRAARGFKTKRTRK